MVGYALFGWVSVADMTSSTKYGRVRRMREARRWAAAVEQRAVGSEANAVPGNGAGGGAFPPSTKVVMAV